MSHNINEVKRGSSKNSQVSEIIDDLVEVFCPYIRNRYTGKLIYPKKAKFFHFYVKRKQGITA